MFKESMDMSDEIEWVFCMDVSYYHYFKIGGMSYRVCYEHLRSPLSFSKGEEYYLTHFVGDIGSFESQCVRLIGGAYTLEEVKSLIKEDYRANFKSEYERVLNGNGKI